MLISNKRNKKIALKMIAIVLLVVNIVRDAWCELVDKSRRCRVKSVTLITFEDKLGVNENR